MILYLFVAMHKTLKLQPNYDYSRAEPEECGEPGECLGSRSYQWYGGQSDANLRFWDPGSESESDW